VAIDRTATLKTAEKLLRQGKVAPAIAEYVRLVEDQPRDWNLANTLGDLYVRVNQVDKAIEQFARIAASFAHSGFQTKASAIYKKILKLQPENEHALQQAADIARSLGILADARSYLTKIIELRIRRGDTRGAAESRITLGTLDPADFAARTLAARARAETGDAGGASRDLKDIAGELLDKGRAADAQEALREAAVLTPDDDDIRHRLLDVYVATGDFAKARECATTAQQLTALAATLESAGHSDAALDALVDAARLDPQNTALQAKLARAFVARGDLQAAAPYLSAETVGDDPQLLFTAAEIHLRGDRADEGAAIVRRILEQHPDRGEAVAFLGWTIAEQMPERGLQVVELAADAAIGRQDWAAAAAALQEFVTRVPNNIPALMRLVEICVDGGLEATMSSAQALLADAYLAARFAAEARFIAEDLVAREPWDRANLERFRRSLEQLGEADPEALIAERLSGQAPFMTTDFFLLSQGLGDDFPEVPADPPVAPDAAPATDVPLDGSPAAGPSDRVESDDRVESEGAARSVDLETILGDLELPPAIAHASGESVEVDLSIVLDDIHRASLVVPAGPAAPAGADASAGVDLDGVFGQLRDDASRRVALERAEEQLRCGIELYDRGEIDACIAALQDASQAPRLRFAAASRLARIFRDRSLIRQAVDWFERAAQAPPPTPEEGHALLYELADALEQQGETARALAISLELQADAGSFRDIRARIDRLTRVQARG
jgi:tetratricopeptide (TPR) repeat protein